MQIQIKIKRDKLFIEDDLESPYDVGFEEEKNSEESIMRF